MDVGLGPVEDGQQDDDHGQGDDRHQHQAGLAGVLGLGVALGQGDDRDVQRADVCRVGDLVGAKLCRLLAERVARVVEDDQRQPGDRRAVAVAGDEALQQVVQLGPFRVVRHLRQPEGDLAVGDRVERQPHVRRRQLYELHVAVQGLGHQERRHRRVAADGGLEVLDRPETLGGQHVALGEDLDHSQVGGGREALSDGVGRGGQVAASGQEDPRRVDGTLRLVLDEEPGKQRQRHRTQRGEDEFR